MSEIADGWGNGWIHETELVGIGDLDDPYKRNCGKRQNQRDLRKVRKLRLIFILNMIIYWRGDQYGVTRQKTEQTEKL